MALAAGDTAPGDVESIRVTRSPSGGNIAQTTLRRGDRVQLRSPSHSGMQSSCQQLPPDSDAFLALCGDLALYRMLEMPLQTFLADQIPRRMLPPAPLIRSQLDHLHHVLAKARNVLLGIVVLAGVVRALVTADRKLWAFFFLTGPAAMLLALTFPVLPVLEGLSEAIVTAQLLTVAERFEFSSQQYGSGHGGGRGRFDAVVPLMQSLRAVCAHRLNLRSLGPGLARTRVPLRAAHLAERLGTVTMLCVVDGDVVCEPFPVAEEIFFLKSSSSTVLDLYSKTLADGSSSLFFEDPFWWQHLPSLKPVGLSCLATTNGSRAVATGTEVTDGARSGPMLASSSPAPSASLLKAQEGGVEDKLLNQPEHMIPRTTTDTSTVRSASSAQSLIEYVRQRSPTEDHLEKLARVIGFDMNDLGAFREKLRVNLVAPQLSDILHTQDINVLSQRDLWRRGSLQPHLTAVVVEDNRSNGLQLLCKGDPKVAVGGCIDYWDGGNISPLTEQDRQAIMDIHQRWTLEDLDVCALSYAPMPHMAEVLFRVPQRDPMFLMESSETMDDAGEAQGASSLLKRRDVPNDDDGTAEPSEKEAVMWSLLREQVFLGMVASRIPLKPSIQEDIDKTMKAGVRFVFFSTRNMRRSKSLAEKMGIETDWNCAISLRAHDGILENPDWMEKARLPHGVEAIRKHIDEVDNVPLLVSLYTDATPEPTREVFEIFQENAESVLCLGSSHCIWNAGKGS